MIPEKLGRFVVEREIGRGAMGQVFLAHDPKIDRQVAIKTLAPQEGVPHEEALETSRRFVREAQAAGRLLHPNIVTIFDVGEQDGVSFIAMEYIDGVTLDRHARPDALLPPARILDLMAQAAAALDHAHAANVIHRDVKPANLMMLKDGTLKVTDFGLAKNPTAHLTQSGVLLGTPSYMSPEQIQGRELDGRSDLFSLGVVLYELLTGVRPFDADSISTIIYRVLYEDPRPPAVHNPALPAEVNLVIEKALAKQPERRYASGGAMVTDLRKAFMTLPPETLSRPFPVASAPVPRAAQGGAATRPSAVRPVSAGRPATAATPRATGRAAAQQAAGNRGPAPAPTLIAHHPVKIAALVVTLAAGILVFPRWVNRAERLAGHRHEGAFARGAAIAGTEGGGEAPPVSAAGMTPQAAAPAGAGTVSIQVETMPHGGTIFLDDLPLAEPRVVLSEGDTKTHDIAARAGCMEAVAQMTAADLASYSGPLVLELRPRRETVTVASQPAGARVRLNGAETGKVTPASIEMNTCDERSVELVRNGYRPWSRTFAAGQSGASVAGALDRVDLQPVPRGGIVVPKAKGYSVDVYEGNTRLGTAGETITLVEGRHTLILRNDKVFVRETAQVAVSGDRTTAASVVLPELGALTVQAQPSNCKVYVDGSYVDVTPVLDLPVAAGGHRVKVVFVPNGATREVDVSIAAGRTERVMVKF